MPVRLNSTHRQWYAYHTQHSIPQHTAHHTTPALHTQPIHCHIQPTDAHYYYRHYHYYY